MRSRPAPRCWRKRLQMTSYVPPAKKPPALMTSAAMSPRFHSRVGAAGRVRGAGSVGSSVGVDVGGRAARRRRCLGREFGGVGRGRRMCPLACLATAQADRDRGQPGGDPAEHEDERDAAEHAGPERPDGRPEQQPAHLGRAVQPERLSAAFRWRRIGQVAAGGRVIGRGRQAGTSAQEQERQRSCEYERQDAEDPGRDQPDHHQWDTGGPVRQPAEDGLADQARRRPGRDDEAEKGEIDALLGEIQRQDGQQGPESEPHDELRQKERDDIAPALEPEVEPGGRGEAGHRRSLAGARILAGPRT